MQSLTVDKTLALRCGDTAAAGQVNEELRRMHKSNFIIDNASSVTSLRRRTFLSRIHPCCLNHF
jgi:hypothetical protein